MVYSGVTEGRVKGGIVVLISENLNVCANIDIGMEVGEQTADEGEVKTGKWVVNSGAGICPYGRQCRRAKDLFL